MINFFLSKSIVGGKRGTFIPRHFARAHRRLYIKLVNIYINIKALKSSIRKSRAPQKIFMFEHFVHITKFSLAKKTSLNIFFTLYKFSNFINFFSLYISLLNPVIVFKIIFLFLIPRKSRFYLEWSKKSP